MRARTPLALVAAAALALAGLLVASPASATVPSNPVIDHPSIQELIGTSSFTAQWEPVTGTNPPTQYEYRMSDSEAVDANGMLVTAVASGITSALTAVIPEMP
ncbi:MAG: hypothetical protein JWO10_1588, partial [Microbacteriaceae bacterium]|nr:hypothetical protein [Microbacteriaceae bacterium]